ncbi:HIT family protein [Hirschia baltica]|uniref:Histidine triad (HIT) protein n=1 Tax=Hirschia baltica (strain ATCC 49814 / DSM 5838 / IFAM 1418) TaxID=582402 RepID=C6XL81_HIRBI|nr:HIT family protein [Hirschia baltica]ACT59680.1 histidine triad (HIT) protein [Hirschia baltica ATCC 49814]
MSLHGTYDNDNIFAKILRGEIPSVKVYEDDVALAFMDAFPQADGHTLVIPKGVTARNFLEMPQEKLGPYMERVQKVAQAVERALAPDGIILTQFNGEAAGQTVYHLHFHIIPRREGKSIGTHAAGTMADMGELETIATEIRAEL